MADRPVLFVTYGAGHAEIVHALLPNLQAADITYKVLGLTAAIPFLESKGCKTLKVSEFIPTADREQVLRIGAELSQGLWTPTTGIPFLESCAYLGTSYLDMCHEVGETRAAKLYREMGRKSFCPVGFLRTVLQSLNPIAVVTTCHVRMERAAVIAANQLGMTSVRIDDLFGNTLDADPDTAPLSGGLIPKPEWPSQVFVMNHWVSMQLSQRGFPAARIHVTGQPAIANTLSEWRNTRPEAQATPAPHQHMMTAKRTIVGIFLPSSLVLLDWLLSIIQSLAGSTEHYHFLLKAHPALDQAELTKRISDKPCQVSIFQSNNLQEFFAEAQIFAGYYSTAGLIARLLGKEYIVLAPDGHPEGLPLISTSQALLASDVASFQEGLRRLLHEPTPPVPRDSPLFCPDNAGAHVARLLRDIHE